ncbi:LysE family translocator [Clostridiisalibacter paucivorans]|uniref:LysE family translocator n=1 Tax=Clostridiisalibacter paucivorans TaxID=408753 RepID=UPI00146FA35D|nr:LysE family transporter [Clostridiisalibacter paucivorans]
MVVLKGILIGIFVSLPVGPIGLLSIQRTLNRGWKIGFLSGVGAAVSDLVYSSIAILGMGFIDDFLERNRYIINEITGILFLIIGISIIMKAVCNKKVNTETKEDIIHPAFSTFLMGLSNPMTFFIFLAIFTKIGIDVNVDNFKQNIVLVISIFLGSSILWFFTSNLVKESKKNYKECSLSFIDKIIGTIISIFGIMNLLKGIMRF